MPINNLRLSYAMLSFSTRTISLFQSLIQVTVDANLNEYQIHTNYSHFEIMIYQVRDRNQLLLPQSWLMSRSNHACLWLRWTECIKRLHHARLLHFKWKSTHLLGNSSLWNFFKPAASCSSADLPYLKTRCKCSGTSSDPNMTRRPISETLAENEIHSAHNRFGAYISMVEVTDDIANDVYTHKQALRRLS